MMVQLGSGFQKIVEDHGGNIYFESSEEGLSFFRNLWPSKE